MQLVTFEPRESSELLRGPAHGRLLGSPTLPLDLEVSRPGGRRLGAVLQSGPAIGDVVDLNLALTICLASEDKGAPEAEADSLLPPDMLAFLQRGERALRTAAQTLEFVEDCLRRYDAPDLGAMNVIVPRRRLRLCAPISRPGKIVGVARNYPAHAEEMGGAESPSEPVLFLKAPSAVVGSEDPIVLPRASRQVDFEGELAVVIGKEARDVPADTALSHVGGYTVANDVTARDFQRARGQHFIGKSCDTFAPLGPSLVTADEIDDPQSLGLHTTVSGEVMQSGNTNEMIFPIASLIAFASRLMTLEPGDVVLTGTPAGVGKGRQPPRWLREGDVVEVEVERVGRLVSHVVSPPRGIRTKQA